jgi:hypothetical protein
VRPDLLSGAERPHFAGLLVATSRPLATLADIDTIAALQDFITHCYNEGKLVAVQHVNGLQIINPRLLKHLKDDYALMGNLLPSHARAAYVNLLLDVLHGQFDDQLQRGIQAEVLLKQLARGNSAS